MFPVQFYVQLIPVYDQTNLIFQEPERPAVMVPCKKMNGDSSVCQTGQRSQNPCIAAGYDIFVFIPEIKKISQQKNAPRSGSQAVQKSDQTTFPPLRITYLKSQVHIR
jgi:hypothetical protein